VSITSRLAARGRSKPAEQPAPESVAEPSAEAAPAVATKPARIEPWKPFPTEALPEPLRTFIDDSARAIGCDPAYVGLPVLVAAAAAIGLTYSLRMKNSWFVKPVLWGCIVGKSGTAKTPAFDAAMAFTRERQNEARERHATAMAQWEQDLDRFDSEHRKWESDGGGEDDEPQKPPRPILERVMTTNVTIEALASLLDSTPRGLLVAVDELSGLIAGFDRYAAGKGGDAPQWLSCYNAGPIIIDRKTGEPRTLYVPRAAVSICGTTQPATLSRVMGREHRESGLLARFLLVAPPSEPAVWSDDDVSEATLAESRELFQRLFDLAPAADEFGKPTPNLVHKSAEAHREWVRFFNRHNERIAELDDEDLRASFKKLEEVAARVALVIHVVRLISNDGVADPTHIDGDSMRAGIALAEWFVGETRRVYQIVGGESPGVSTRRRLLDWVAKRGGPVTVRDVYTNCRWLKEPDAAENALGELVGDGLGNWIEQPTGARGGRPTRQFVLSASAKPSGTRGIRGCADADNADGSANPEDWGAE
jgi:hypothetical protein